METLNCFEINSNIFLFKSYYVVWKLFLKFQKDKNNIKFKSYYVVWKHTDEKNNNGKI